MGIVSELARDYKISSMSYNEAINEIKKILSSSDKTIFEELLNNFKKFCKKGQRFPCIILKDVLKRKNAKSDFNMLNDERYGLKKAYIKYFKNNLFILVKNNDFRNKLNSIKKYEDFVVEQNNYYEFLDNGELYKEKTNTKKVSSSYSSTSSNYFSLQTDEEKIKYLETQYEIKFGIYITIYSYELKEKETEFFNKLVEKEIEEKKEKENQKDEEEDKEKYNYEYSDNNNDNYYYKNNSDDDNDDNNDDDDNNNYHNYNTYSGYSSHSSYSSSNSSSKNRIINNNYSSNKGSTSNKSSNTKKRVKVILCYSCKTKNRCPLCGIKMGTKVSLGNMYAHEGCYNEGTCVLCNKKGPGNQVQSICSSCRKSKSSNGLTGSGRCFICRKLM